MPRRADVQLYARILSKLLGFVPVSKYRQAGKVRTACRAARRSYSDVVMKDHSAIPGSRAVRCAMEILRASGPKTIRTISSTETVPATSISA
jgi:hypothetical protein